MNPLRTLLGMAAAVLLTQGLGAQTVGGGWERDLGIVGRGNGTQLGQAVDWLPDVDGDGVPDIALGGDFARPGLLAVIVSGRNREILRECVGPFDAEAGIPVRCAGDVDADGIADVIVARGDFAAVFSGATGTMIHLITESSTYLREVNGVGDLDLDGHAEVGIAGDSGVVWIYSGANATLMSSHAGYSQVEGGADLDGDGHPDFVVGRRDIGSPGKAHAISGADGSTLWLTTGPSVKRIDLADDVDGDGVADFVVSDSRWDGIHEGRYWVLSGADGQVLYDGAGTSPGENLGDGIAGIGDVDRDGHGDFAVAANLNSVRIHSGADGSVMRTLDGAADGDHYGADIAGGYDRDRDGFPELLIGAPGLNNTWSSNCGGADVIGYSAFLALDADTLHLATRTPLRIRLEFPKSEANMRFAILVSASGEGPSLIGGIDVPLTLDPLLQQMLGGWRIPGLDERARTLDGNGIGRARIRPTPMYAALIGQTYTLAAVTFAPGSGSLRLSSAAQTVTFVQ